MVSRSIAVPPAITGLSAPENDTQIVAYDQADPARRQRIDQAIRDIDLKNSQAILCFGSAAQEQLTSISDSVLEGVRNKDIGPAGNALSSMLTALRGLDVSQLDPARQRGLLDKLLGTSKPLAKFLQRYEHVRSQLDVIGDQLERYKTRLLTDIVSLDRLYEANLIYFHNLADYIVAGEEKLRQLDDETIPTLQREVDHEADSLMAQELRDIWVARDDLERRVHDLRLTRQVAMQNLPSIRLVQENDKSLVNKITSVITNTVPLWRHQLAQTLTIYRSREVSRVIKDATDLTSDLLLTNAQTLRQANIEVNQQLERGVFDIDTVKKANDLLIATLQDSLRVADEGKRKRAEAVLQLQKCENELRNMLLEVRSQTTK